MVKYIRWRYFGLPKANQSDLFGALLTASEVQLVLGRLIKAQVKLQLFLQKFHNSKKEVFLGNVERCATGSAKMPNRVFLTTLPLIPVLSLQNNNTLQN